MTHILHLSAEVIAQATKIAQDLSILAANPGYNAQIQIVNAVHLNPESFSALGADVVTQLQSINLSFLGLNLGDQPTFGWNWLIIIPILSGLTSILTSLISSKFNASGQEVTGMSKGMILMMPLFSLFFTFQVPAGVGLYWTVSNILSAVQVLVLNKIYDPKKIAAQAAAEWEAEKKRKKKIVTTTTDESGEEKKKEVTLSKKELDRRRLAEARRRDAEKYGDIYKEVTDEDLQ
jgi:YidC/Oxa1 family membrane protein insertase